MKKLIFDISSYQGKVNFDKLLSEPTEEESFYFPDGKEKPSAIVIRSGISWGYTDKFFTMNYAGVKSVGIRPAIYHVFRPDADVDQQVDALLRLLELVGYDGTHCVIPDIELHLGYDDDFITKFFFKCYDRFTKEFSKRQITYSAQWFINSYMKFIDRFKETDLKWWLAAYGHSLVTGSDYAEMSTELFLSKYVPSGIPQENVLAHQFTDRFNDNCGKLYGMESFYLDASRWLGTEEQFSYYFGGKVEPSEEPVEEPVEYPIEKTVSVGDSHLAMRDENMEIRGWLETGCKVNLVGETSKGIGKDGEVHTYQKCTIDCNLADEYLV